MPIPKTVWAAGLAFALICGGAVALAKAPAQGKVPAESRKLVKPGEKRGFNPQPEPPAEGHKHIRPGGKHGFNPQPEPPTNPKTRAPTRRTPVKPGGTVQDDMHKSG